MSDLFASTLFVFAVYCAWAIAVYKPATHPAVTVDPTAPVDYFPEEEEPAPPALPAPVAPVVEVQLPQPVATDRRPAKTKTLRDLIVSEVASRQDYSALTVRQLYQLASQQGIKNAKRKSKTELLQLLA